MKYPNKKQREAIATIIADLPEDQREERARLLRFALVSYMYHKETEILEPTKTDFEEWLIALPKDTRNNMENLGFELCKDIISFNRYVLEKNDIGMSEWMKKHLSEDDHIAYCKLIEDRKKLD
ncbi:hypothetical protein [Gelidibacter mesophilus]|uniref:hypothetical protein n=1 Tax=Gelidibacter mesophilus TaxID=169050 RepID=UPI00041F3526|nr:hypothetical protein [Gelidibacter mesophilus]